MAAFRLGWFKTAFPKLDSILESGLGVFSILSSFTVSLGFTVKSEPFLFSNLTVGLSDRLELELGNSLMLLSDEQAMLVEEMVLNEYCFIDLWKRTILST